MQNVHEAICLPCRLVKFLKMHNNFFPISKCLIPYSKKKSARGSAVHKYLFLLILILLSIVVCFWQTMTYVAPCMFHHKCSVPSLTVIRHKDNTSMLLPTQKCYITPSTMKKSNLFSFLFNICKCFPDSSLLVNYADFLCVFFKLQFKLQSYPVERS